MIDPKIIIGIPLMIIFGGAILSQINSICGESCIFLEQTFVLGAVIILAVPAGLYVWSKK